MALLCAAIGLRAVAQTYSFTTLAGRASIGSSDGIAGDARFFAPLGVAVDGNGNVFVADTGNHVIRKIAPDGAVTTFAGAAGIRGSVDGAGGAARFNFPSAVVVDQSGNLFVADTRNHVIRKITAAGLVTTVGGTAGSSGSADAAGSAARFASPSGVAVDRSGNLFVADSGNRTIRKITTAGAVTTLAGTPGLSGSSDGVGGAARFGNPFGVAVDPNGTVFVTDSFWRGSSRNPLFDYTIRKITPDGVVTTLVASTGGPMFLQGGDGAGSAAGIGEPRALAVDAGGNLFFADFGNWTIRRLAPDGTVTTLAGLPTSLASTPVFADSTGRNARFARPSGVAVDRNGTVFVADTGNNAIRKVTAKGVVTTLAGAANEIGVGADGTGGAARFVAAYGLAMDGSGNVLVADSQTLRSVAADGTATTIAGIWGAGFSASPTQFSGAQCVALDSRGTVLVSNRRTIQRIAPDGTITTLAGNMALFGTYDGTGAAAGFSQVEGMALDRSGNVYATDSRSHTIRKITPAGVVTTLAGVADSDGSADGVGSAARFYGPKGIAVDAQGTLFVADSYNGTIRKITATGVVTTLAGQAGIVGSVDGPGSAARFYHPTGVGLDAAGNLFVGDPQNNTVRKVAPDGIVTTFAGTAGIAGLVDGAGRAVRFNSPDAVTVDSSGNVLVADTRRIRRITPGVVVTTLAGGHFGPGYADGAGNVARFGAPLGVAVDGSGNVYVSDSYNSAIRKITPGGMVTTLAGQAGIYGFSDGVGSVAGFSGVAGLAVDGSGNVFVGDTGNSAIRKVNPDGVVTTLAGGARSSEGGPRGYADGTGSAARFDNPFALAIDESGIIFVADQGNGVIRKVTQSGVVTTLRDPAGNVLRFNASPQGLAVDQSNNLFVVGYNTILKVSAAGIVATLAGKDGAFGFADGPGAVARFNYPTSLAVDGSGNVFVTDRENMAIRMITPDGVVTTVGGFALGTTSADFLGSADGLGSAARFNRPIGIAVDRSGNVFVADTENNVIRKGVPLANPARLINVSVLAALGSDNDTVTVGTIIGGVGTSGAKPLLVRAVGPSLAPFGVTSPLADPKLEFYAGSTKIGENDDWGGSASTSAGFARVGAFPFATPTSKDATLSLASTGAGNTGRVSGAGVVGGTVLAEIYDDSLEASLTPSSPRLLNISVLNFVGSGLTAGFVVKGEGIRTVLIRAVGPSLAPFGVSGLLADPRLELFDGQSRSIAVNDNWSDAGVLAATELSAAFTQVGAFALASPTSKDAAMLATLTPGNYTVQVRSADSTTGVALVEVYEMP